MNVLPFTAIVGQSDLKQALVLNAINPDIGGVLIRGEKGTAKSTLARALAELLPEIPVVEGCPYQCDPAEPLGECTVCRGRATEPLPIRHRRMRVVTLPNNATEDRVVGSLDLEHALEHGQRRFEPGILAEAHRGILYIDEVNLLSDHVVDLLLDAAAMGVNIVEREGVSMNHPARFILIGTMNPEEGELRPQLLDRFGLCVQVQALMTIEERCEVVRRRLQWERDPNAVRVAFAEQQAELARAIVAARERLPRVAISDEHLEQAARICIDIGVRSHRGDIVIAKTAITLAAFEGRDTVIADDIRRAARLALPHRLRHQPFQQLPADLTQMIDNAFHRSEAESASEQTPDELPEQTAPPESRVFDIATPPPLALPEVEIKRTHTARGSRRGPATPAPQGRYTRAVLPKGPVASSDIAVDATLRASASRQSGRGNGGSGIVVQPQDIRVKERKRPTEVTIILVVDASGSMAAAERMAAAKGAVLSLLRDAYVKRQRVALIAFRNDRAEVLLQPTNSLEMAYTQLKEMPTGGRTPLAHGLAQAAELARQIRYRDVNAAVFCVLLTDGRANVSLGSGSSEASTPFDEAVAVGRDLVQSGVQLLVLDTEGDFLALGQAQRLAQATGALYDRLSRIEAEVVAAKVRAHVSD